MGLALTIIVGAGARMSAHRLDEYLQAARITLDPERVHIDLDLTPGIAVADAVVGVIDRDQTGTISADEAEAYSAAVLGAVRLEVDGKPLHLDLTNTRFPAIEAIKNGEGVIHLELDAGIGPLSAGPHHLLYRNTHRPDIGAYLANVLVPASDRVAVTAQRRDIDQRELIVDYVLRAGPLASARDRFLPIIAGLFIVLCALWWRRRQSMLAHY